MNFYSDTIAEELKRLFLEIYNSGKQKFGSILFISPRGGEGTTTLASLFAMIVAAHTDTNTLIIDANLRRPRLHKLFRLKQENGISDWNGIGEPYYKQSPVEPLLYVLTSGAGTRTGSFWFKFPRIIKSILEKVKGRFKYIIIDSAPYTAFPDAHSIAANVDGIIIVVESDKTRKDHLEYMKKLTEGTPARVFGVILNRSGRFMPGLKSNRQS